MDFGFKAGSTLIGGGFSFSNEILYEQVDEESVLSNFEGFFKLLSKLLTVSAFMLDWLMKP